MKKIYDLIDFGFDIENTNKSDLKAAFLFAKCSIVVHTVLFVVDIIDNHKAPWLNLVLIAIIFYAFYSYKKYRQRRYFILSIDLAIIVVPIAFIFTLKYLEYQILIFFMLWPLIVFLLNGVRFSKVLLIIFSSILFPAVFYHAYAGYIDFLLALNFFMGFITSSCISFYIENNRKEDITHLKRAKNKLERISHIDELTQLYNRYFLNSQILTNKNILGKKFAFCMGDIDNFKKYNDHYGHQKGDKVLQEFSKILKSSFGKADDSFVVRMGGEEFGVFIFNIQDIKPYVNDFFQQLKVKAIEHNYNENYGRCTMSMGGTYHTLEEDFDFSVLYDKVDAALYKAKNSGRNRIIYV